MQLSRSLSVLFALSLGPLLSLGSVSSSVLGSPSRLRSSTSPSPSDSPTYSKSIYAGGVVDPAGVAVDPTSGVVYVANANNMIRVGSLGEVSIVHEGETGYLPQLAADSMGNVYTADQLYTDVDHFNGFIYETTPAGVTTVFAQVGSSVDELWGVAVGAGDVVYVTVCHIPGANNTCGAGWVTKVARNGTQTIVATGFIQPQALAYDHNSGQLYVADQYHNAVFVVDSQGEVASFVNCTYPRGLAVDEGGNVYITSEQSVLKATPAGAVTPFVTQFANKSLGWPTGLAFAPNGDLYVTDYIMNNILSVTPAGVVSRVVYPLGAPSTLGFDENGDLLVLNEESVVRVSETSGGGRVVSTLASGLGVAGTSSPSVMAVCPNYDMYAIIYNYVSGNNTIAKITAAGVVNATFDSPAESLTSLTCDHNGNLFAAGPANNGSLYQVMPDGQLRTVATQTESTAYVMTTNPSTGIFYMTDTPGNRIVEVDQDGNVSTFVSTINRPWGLCFDPSGSGDLYVVNGVNQFQNFGSLSVIASDGNVTTLSTELESPVAVAVDALGNVFVTDLQIVFKFTKQEVEQKREQKREREAGATGRVIIHSSVATIRKSSPVTVSA